MNKLLIALFAGAFAFISASAFADDSTLMPLSKMDTEQAKAAKKAAAEKWAKMTPEEQAAAKKAARAKRLADANALDELANESTAAYDPKEGAKATAASKAQPKATKEERKKALAEQEKKASQ